MNEEGKNPLGFEVVDKRGRNNPVQEAPKVVEAARDDSPVKERQWESVGYMIVLLPFEGDTLVAGRAAGLDYEEDVFMADYIFGPGVEPGFDWTIDAKRRLDTFLRCQCSRRNGRCQFHRKMAPRGWMSEDFQRIRTDGERAMPKVLELLSRMERTRQQAQRILAPRG